jgi:hypothetical protein
MTTKIFPFIFSLVFFSSCLFGRAVPGDLTFTFTPQSPGAYSTGTWQAVVFCPDGHTISTGQIDCTSLDVIPLIVSDSPQGYTVIGTYFIELQSNVAQADQPFLSSIIIDCDSTLVTIDTITFKNMPVLGYGENTQITYTAQTN